MKGTGASAAGSPGAAARPARGVDLFAEGAMKKRVTSKNTFRLFVAFAAASIAAIAIVFAS